MVARPVKLKFTLILMLAGVLAVACTRIKDIPTEFPTPEPPPGPTPLPAMVLKRDARLEAEFAKIAEEAKGRVGAAAVVLETGDAALFNPEGRYPMQSVYKLPIAMAVMEQVRLGQARTRRAGRSDKGRFRPARESTRRSAINIQMAENLRSAN